MTIKELKEAIANVPDDYAISFDIDRTSSVEVDECYHISIDDE